ncbi:MAG: tetratricopeptide repeat protein [Bacteroidota bacterium]
MSAAQNYFDEAVAFEEKGEFEKATVSYQKATEEDASFTAAYNGWGNALLNLDRREEAREKYEKVLELDPTYQWAVYNIGRSYQGEDDLKAAEYFGKATEIDPTYIEAFNRWGNALLALEKNVEAREKYEKCLELDANYKWAFYNLGRSYQDDDNEKAAEYFEKATISDPAYIDAYNIWGNVLLDMEKKDEARNKYGKCLELDQDYKWAYYNLGRSFEGEDNVKAASYFEKATEKDSSYIDAFNRWGNALLNRELLVEARQKYEKCLTIDEDYKWAFYNLARSYDHEDPLKAIAYYQTATEKDEEYMDAFFRWGNELFILDRFEEAREKYERCLELDPDYKWAFLNLGISYQSQNPQKAIGYYHNIIDRDAADHDAFNGLYYCITLLDETKDQIEEFHSLVQKLNSPAGFFALGNLQQYYLLDYEKSLAYYQKSEELGFEKGLSLDLSNLYDSMGNLEKSLEVLENPKKTDIVEENIYPYHNKAHYLLKMGRYDKSRALWKDVLAQYEEAFENDQNFKLNSDNYLYYGSIHFEIFGEITEAQKAFQKGMEVQQNKKNLKLLVSQKKHLAEIDKISLDSKLSTFWQRNANLQHAEKVFKETVYKPEEDYYQLVEMYLTVEMFEEAQTVLDDYFDTDKPKSSRWYNLKGQLFLAKEEYGKAISAFKKAIKLEGHSFSLRNNLANAHLRIKNYADAELVFEKVLKRDPNNVDALIGLGEIYLTRSSDDDPDELLLEKSEKYFMEALHKGRSPQGSKQLNQYEPKVNQKRKYKDLKLSDLYYSLGYIKYKQYQKSEIQDRNQFIKDSLNFFRKSQEANPENLKAKKAKEKIDNSILSFQKSSRTENLGAIMVTGLSLIVFLLGQYFFYFHSSGENEVSLTQQNVAQLGGILALDSMEMANIRNLVSVTFEEKTALLKAVESSVAKAKTVGKMEVLNALSLGKQESVKAQIFLPPGYYALISFGAIMFMIAGFYLPKLLKLKVGVIEIEKNSLSEVHDFSLLGIQK